MNDTLKLLESLIACRSVTPADGGCQELVSARLKALGFNCETLVFGPEDGKVTNLWATRKGAKEGPTLVLAGHTDVVPTGPVSEWKSDPFIPTQREGKLYGRGASDMKASIAAMVVAAERFVQKHPDHRGTLAFMVTSDEEGPSVDGIKRVVETLRERKEKLDYCIIGEPSSSFFLGDTIKNGRRGTLSGKLTVRGVQGHVAYPHLAKNPIHMAAPALAELVAVEWDQGNEHFPPTTWQISNIHAGTGVGNVIPGEVVIDFNFRFSTASTSDGLKQRMHELLDRHGLDYTLAWTLGGEPFLTPVGQLSETLTKAIQQVAGTTPELSTAGGTSDGRFIAKICPQVVEFGPPHGSIHKVNEHVAIGDLEPLTEIFRLSVESMLG